MQGGDGYRAADQAGDDAGIIVFVGFTNAAAGGYAVLRSGLIPANAAASIQLAVRWLARA